MNERIISIACNKSSILYSMVIKLYVDFEKDTSMVSIVDLNYEDPIP